MAVYVEYCLFCDILNCNENWWDGGNCDMKPKERRKLAKEDGWSYRKNKEGKMEDLCPKCSINPNRKSVKRT